MPLNRKAHQPHGAAPRLRDHHSAARWLAALLLAGAAPSFADEVPGVLLDGSYAFLGGPQFSLNGGGEQPVGRLARGPDGSFYGVTAGYGAGDADYGEISTPPTIFRIKPGPGGGFTTLHRFADTQAQGGYLFGPSDGLVRGTDGHYYGTTIGDIFRITADGTFSILHHFDPAGSEGFGGAALTLGRDGRLYGVTGGGAFGIFPNSLGGVIRVEADGQVTVLHRFTGAEGRALAIGNLLQARDGNFYGVTCCGGAAGAGSLFRITPAGDYTVLYAFPANQGGPKSPLVQGQDGDLYGSTQGYIDSEGEERAAGTLFRITAAGEVHTLHAFSVARGEDGIYPGGLVAGADGRIYGVARGGGRAGGGAVFRVDRDGRYEALYAFDGAHGAGPARALARGRRQALRQHGRRRRPWRRHAVQARSRHGHREAGSAGDHRSCRERRQGHPGVDSGAGQRLRGGRGLGRQPAGQRRRSRADTGRRHPRLHADLHRAERVDDGPRHRERGAVMRAS